MRRPNRGIWRNLRGVGNFYTRKYVFGVTQQPIDLFFGGTFGGNRTVLGDFDLESLAATSVLGATNLAEITAISNLFTYARIRRARIFWRTSGDKTNARYNLGAADQSSGPGSGIAANTLAIANPGGTTGDFCGTYPRRGNEDPNATSYSMTSLQLQPYSVAFVAQEPYQSVVQQTGFRRGSVWGGQRTFIPSVLENRQFAYQINVSGSPKLQIQQNYKPAFSPWMRTYQETNVNTLNYNYMENFRAMRYQGMNLSVPQVGIYSMNQNGINALPTYGKGDYFLNVWIELDIEWKKAVSSGSNQTTPGFQLQEQDPNGFTHVVEKVKDGIYDAYTTNDGPPLPKVGKFAEAADAISSGLGLLSRMKRD